MGGQAGAQASGTGSGDVPSSEFWLFSPGLMPGTSHVCGSFTTLRYDFLWLEATLSPLGGADGRDSVPGSEHGEVPFRWQQRSRRVTSEVMLYLVCSAAVLGSQKWYNEMVLARKEILKMLQYRVRQMVCCLLCMSVLAEQGAMLVSDLD